MTTSLKLFANPNSPFALKVQILARELGLFARLEIDETVVANPTAHSTSHSALVPNGKLPALIVNGDTPIYGSEIICQYLVSIADRKPTGYVDAGLTKFEQATTEALAGSIMDAALLMRYERLSRPENLRWEDWITGQRSKITYVSPVPCARDVTHPASNQVDRFRYLRTASSRTRAWRCLVPTR